MNLKVLLVRHAPAVDREDFSLDHFDDSQRPLTAEGIEKMKKGADGLLTIEPQVDCILTSPYIRTLQTAEILYQVYQPCIIKTEVDLASGARPKTIIQLLKNLKNQSTVVLVGHEPDLGFILSQFCAGSMGPHFFEFKKGGIACVEFFGEIELGKAILSWALKPSQLRALARSK